MMPQWKHHDDRERNRKGKETPPQKHYDDVHRKKNKYERTSSVNYSLPGVSSNPLLLMPVSSLFIYENRVNRESTGEIDAL